MKWIAQAELCYWEFTPDKAEGSSSIVIFLHGSGERGDDPQQVLSWALPAHFRELQNYPFSLIAPQCPISTQWSDHLGALDDLLGELLSKHQHSQAILAGFSMGGEGVLELGAFSAKSIARIVAVAPRCSNALTEMGFERLADRAVHLVHGRDDPIVPLANSIEIKQRLKRAGSTQVGLEVLSGRDHFITQDAFELGRFTLKYVRPVE